MQHWDSLKNKRRIKIWTLKQYESRLRNSYEERILAFRQQKESHPLEFLPSDIISVGKLPIKNINSYGTLKLQPPAATRSTNISAPDDATVMCFFIMTDAQRDLT